MRFTIDRFEGEFAIVELENRKMVDFPRILLPVEAKEGDIIIVSVDGFETEKRKKIIQDKFSNLLNQE